MHVLALITIDDTLLDRYCAELGLGRDEVRALIKSWPLDPKEDWFDPADYNYDEIFGIFALDYFVDSCSEAESSLFKATPLPALADPRFDRGFTLFQIDEENEQALKIIDGKTISDYESSRDQYHFSIIATYFRNYSEIFL